MTQLLTGGQFKAMVQNAAAAIELHKTEVNELNVFPVPDGDTGTNMSLTLSSGARALGAEEPRSVSRAAELTASALLRGARGNSGVILSLLFRGMAKRLKDAETADAALFAAAMRDGVDAAYKAVMKPAEGTILTVSRLSADAAIEAAASGTDDIEAVLERAADAGRLALADTINQNPVLKKAGVIDSGGRGYVYILNGMLRALRGEKIDAGEGAAERGAADFAGFSAEDITFAYCTEFIVRRENARGADALRAFLDARGDSIVVVDDDELIKVHVHTNEPGDVLTEALAFGALLSVKIENMREQHTEKLVTAAERGPAPRRAAPEKRFGAVAVCSGAGLEAVFRDLGADAIVTGGQTMNPSTEDILAAVESVPAGTVFVYPNNKNIIMAAEQAVPLASRRVVVVPSKSIPQGVAAMLAFDENAGADGSAAAQLDVMARVRTALITRAARDSAFDGRAIREGEYLALLDDELVAVGPDFSPVADGVVAALLPEPPEFVTVFAGEGASKDETELLRGLLEVLPSAELTIVDGGQPVYRFIISAE
ncbi:MAG: DAK2 domain-containing protein [Oscillospiraceae bacterium]|nr:DAK2 domain-containing protein [Oscillospiraceae bacterium]